MGLPAGQSTRKMFFTETADSLPILDTLHKNKKNSWWT